MNKLPLTDISKKCKPYRKWLAAILIGGILYYGFLLFTQHLDLNIARRELALYGAVHLAFGQTRFLNEQKFTIPSELLQQCKIKHSSDKTSCHLIMPEYAEFYKKCQRWRFEECAVIVADPLFLNDSNSLSQLITILKDPCPYLADAKQANYKMSDFDSNWRDLRCGNERRANMKTILMFRDDSNELFTKTIISKVGKL